jgi:hypothetical protein
MHAAPYPRPPAVRSSGPPQLGVTPPRGSQIVASLVHVQRVRSARPAGSAFSLSDGEKKASPQPQVRSEIQHQLGLTLDQTGHGERDTRPTGHLRASTGRRTGRPEPGPAQAVERRNRGSRWATASGTRFFERPTSAGQVERGAGEKATLTSAATAARIHGWPSSSTRWPGRPECAGGVGRAFTEQAGGRTSLRDQAALTVALFPSGGRPGDPGRGERGADGRGRAAARRNRLLRRSET